MIDFGQKDPLAMNSGESIIGNTVGEWICKWFPNKLWTFIGIVIMWALGWIGAGVLIRVGFNVYDYLAKLF